MNRIIKNKDCIEKIKRLKEKLEQLHNVKIILDPNISIGLGDCPSIIDKKSKINIGVHEIKRKLFNIDYDVDISLLTTAVVSLHHEVQHCVQSTEYFNENKVIDTNHIYMLTNLIACMGAYEGYYNPHVDSYNYFHNPREIDAEYEGIIGAHEYLSNLYSEDIANELILDYINNKDYGYYFINTSSPYTLIEDVDQAFKEAYENSKKDKRKYRAWSKDEDESIRYALGLNGTFLSCFSKIKDPAIQDKILAGAYLKSLEEVNDFELDDVFPLLEICKKDIYKEFDEFIEEIRRPKTIEEYEFLP